MTQIRMWRVSYGTLPSSNTTGSAIEVEHVSELLTIDEAENLIRELSDRPGIRQAHIRRDLLVASGKHRNDAISV